MKYFALGAVALGSVLAASTALADECASDADCPVGFACEEIFWGACPGMPPCFEGEECPEPMPCEEGSEWICSPAPVACASDADCTDGFECVSFTYETCSGGAPVDPTMPPDSDGSDSSSGSSGGAGTPDDSATPDGEPDMEGDDDWSCEVVTESYCAPPYVGGCATADDCGPGFDCVEMEECACSGGGGMDGEAPPPVPDDPTDPTPDDSGSDDSSGFPEPECECFGAGEFYCQPQEIECAADADCPADWTCEDFGGPDVTEACWVDESGEVVCETDDSAGSDDSGDDSYLRCAPPAWEAWGGAGMEEGAPSLPTSERGEGADDGMGMPNPWDDDSDGASDPVQVSGPRPIDASGCTAAGARPGSAFGLVLLLGALVASRRRRP